MSSSVGIRSARVSVVSSGNQKAGKSRYNLICAEHAVLGNLAYLAGTNLARWEIWDGIRAVDYLLTRPDVDSDRINITGTSGGGFQTALIAALDPQNQGRNALLLHHRPADAGLQPHLQRSRQRSRAGPLRHDLKRHGPPRVAVDDVSASGFRGRSRARLFPYRGHAQNLSRSGRSLQPVSLRRPDWNDRKLQRPSVLRPEPGSGSRIHGPLQ